VGDVLAGRDVVVEREFYYKDTIDRFTQWDFTMAARRERKEKVDG